MAFSMFLRTPACRNLFTQQLRSLATQPVFAQRAITSSLPAGTIGLKNLKTAPIFESVRPFRTTAVRLSDEVPHDHARLWVIEKATAALMVPLIPIALAFPNKILDSAVAVLIVAHSFWGLEAIAVDYVRASIFGPVIPKIAIGLVYAISIATLGGLFYLISNDVGLANTIRQVWGIKSQQKA